MLRIARLPLTLAALLSLALTACGGASSLSCNNAAEFVCQNISVTGGITLNSCTAPFVEVASCATAGRFGTCTLTSSVTVSGVTGTQTLVTMRYPGGIDAAAAQAACAAANGTWATP